MKKPDEKQKFRYKKPRRPGVLLRLARRIFFWGRRRYCPVCQSSVRLFQPAGHRRRLDACCPVCGSVERHRLTWLYFVQQTPLFTQPALKMLHIAPEPEFERQLRRSSNLNYITLDPQDTSADINSKLEATGLPDRHYDIIHCSHVLEHVENDHACIKEIARILKADGLATILVPIIAEQSHEDPTITDPNERARLYGQWDHVRAYGPDFIDRLRENGLDPVLITAKDLVPDPEERVRLALGEEQLFACKLFHQNSS